MTEERVRAAHEVEFGELPELTRALRALGSSRRSGGSFQSQFFHPLLEARRRAADARTPAGRIHAFAVPDLRKALERGIDKIVADWPDKREPVRRALRADLTERVAPYATALAALAAVAERALHTEERSQLAVWREWTSQLAATFEAADRSWMALRSVVDSLTLKAQP